MGSSQFPSETIEVLARAAETRVRRQADRMSKPCNGRRPCKTETSSLSQSSDRTTLRSCTSRAAHQHDGCRNRLAWAENQLDQLRLPVLSNKLLKMCLGDGFRDAAAARPRRAH